MIEKRILKDREEWLANRTNGIGGSEVAAVIGLSPYMTNVELWEYKTGLKKRPAIDNEFTRYGHAAEEHIRELYKLDHPTIKVEYEDNNSWTNTDYPFAKASLDGWQHDDLGRFGVLEIKTAEIMASNATKWKGKVPDNYFCQVLFYMAVTNAEFADLVAQLKFFNRKEIREYHFEREEVQESIDYLMSNTERFWHEVETKKRPNLFVNI